MGTSSSIERLASRLGVAGGSRQIGRTTLVRLIGYYVVVLVVVAGFILLTDNMRGTRFGGDKVAAGDSAAQLTSGMFEPLFRSLPPLGTGAAAGIASFLLALPLAFTYVRTRNSLKYDQAVVQTVIMLPVVVTTILVVVENSLALAFSLAGIVAAVRFRNNLKDSRDAVYIFAAVGIGFATGVGALAIAAFLSIFFCVLELLLWKLDLSADHEHTFGLLCLPAPRKGESIPPVAPVVEKSSMSGDASVATPSADTGLLALGGGQPAPVDLRGRRPAERLLVYCTDPQKARALADGILGEMAKSYKLKRTSNGGNDRYVLEYRVRTRRRLPGSAIVDRLQAQAAPYLVAAEIVAGDHTQAQKTDRWKA